MSLYFFSIILLIHQFTTIQILMTYLIIPLENNHNYYSKMEGNINLYTKYIQSLQKQVAADNHQRSVLTSQLTKITNYNQELQRKIIRHHSLLSSLHPTYLEGQNDQEIQLSIESISRLKQTVEELNQEITNIYQINQNLDIKYQQTKEELENARATINELKKNQKQWSTLKMESINMQQKIKWLQNENQLLNKTVKEAEERYNQMESLRNEQQNKNQEQKVNFELEKNNLKTQIKRLQEELISKTSKNPQIFQKKKTKKEGLKGDYSFMERVKVIKQNIENIGQLKLPQPLKVNDCVQNLSIAKQNKKSETAKDKALSLWGFIGAKLSRFSNMEVAATQSNSDSP